MTKGKLLSTRRKSSGQAQRTWNLAEPSSRRLPQERRRSSTPRGKLVAWASVGCIA